MNKEQLTAALADKMAVTKTEAEKFIGAFVTTIKESLVNADPVTIIGFGTFGVSERAARSGRNPRTGAEIQIAASKAVSFKAGKLLKDAVNEAKK